jgi:hypothetical protein
MEKHTLRPGLLVSMKTRLNGNVSYRKKDIERPHRTEEGAQRAKWETVRTIRDPAEHERAVKVRSKIRNTIAGVCAHSDFGLLCPLSKRDELDKAIAKGRKLADEFNESSAISKVEIYVITGEVSQNDAEAIRAIRSEVAELIGTMTDGLKRLDVKAVRDAAKKARGVVSMLTDEAASRANEAIANARAAARKLVKAGEAASVAIDGALMQSLAEARTSFLDVDAKPAEVAAPEAETRAIETNEIDPSPLADIDMPDLDLELSAPEAA